MGHEDTLQNRIYIIGTSDLARVVIKKIAEKDTWRLVYP